MTLPFADSAQSTLGIEWELALVDAVSGELRSEAPDLLRALHVTEGLAEDDVNPHMTSELLQNTVELVTGVHERVDAATADLGRIAARVADAAAERGISLFCQGTHPFADAIAQPSTPSERYDRMLDLTQYWGRQMLIFGVHVHVGLDDVSKAMPVVNGLVNRVPHLLALSASSPFWAGTDTGYQSQRTLLFQQLPTAGLPFQFQEWEGFERCVAQMEQVGMIADVTECRWDVRAVPRLGTVEMRACDGLATLEEIAAVTAYTQCLVDDLSASLERGETVEVLPPWHVQENKWRAARYGMDATVIVDARGTQVPLAEHLPAEIERLTPVAERLGCAAELAGVQAMIDDGGAAARQRRVEAQALAGPPAAGEDTDDAVAPLRAVVLDAAARTRASLDGRTG
ncbi:glutamate--cysteine ligase [Micrococcus luteus]|nr:glutamate--cysteine ligase [Micrococcus luteus]MCV7487112.1 glutamate--cysteine ligase [Micrococcus luteus]MCV7598986.1 glutamate--cysteine ligase [Micrococcus luteus]